MKPTTVSYTSNPVTSTHPIRMYFCADRVISEHKYIYLKYFGRIAKEFRAYSVKIKRKNKSIRRQKGIFIEIFVGSICLLTRCFKITVHSGVFTHEFTQNKTATAVQSSLFVYTINLKIFFYDLSFGEKTV